MAAIGTMATNSNPMALKVRFITFIHTNLTPRATDRRTKAKAKGRNIGFLKGIA